MKKEVIQLPSSQKIYFASDFHLGVPDHQSSLQREMKVIRWLDEIKADAHAIYLLGDIFDFWFEYKYTIPKGFIRLQGKLAELTDGGLPIHFFTGNHDMWMFDYFPKELNIRIHREPLELVVGRQSLLIGHGDGLGPGDLSYKVLKKFFGSAICQWLFGCIHPNFGMRLANYWSKNSRINNQKQPELEGDDEFLLTYCREMEQQQHRDFYIFGHRHLPLDLPVGEQSRYINLGEWVNYNTYACYDGQTVELRKFES